MRSMQPQGVAVALGPHENPQTQAAALDRASCQWLAPLGLADALQTDAQEATGAAPVWVARLGGPCFERLCPAFDTLGLRPRLAALSSDPGADGLAAEVWAGLLAAPERLHFASLAELQAHVRVRCHIARAAETTALAFKTSDAAERPEAFWRHEEGEGFLLQPGVDLVDALVAATQPERTGRLYDFSCYRATEYVILLGLAQEARESNPALYQQLAHTARHRCIKSGRFHEVFLVEYGSLEAPVPARYYVPGDRVWFKNPHEPSSNASGFEGSWVIYLGGGLFSNFWQRGRPFTLEAKALEVFHWRDGLYLDAAGEPQIDERVVEAQVAATQADPQRRAQVLERMCRLRDPSGVYGDGGCLDASREFPRPLARLALA